MQTKISQRFVFEVDYFQFQKKTGPISFEPRLFAVEAYWLPPDCASKFEFIMKQDTNSFK